MMIYFESLFISLNISLDASIELAFAFFNFKERYMEAFLHIFHTVGAFVFIIQKIAVANDENTIKENILHPARFSSI